MGNSRQLQKKIFEKITSDIGEKNLAKKLAKHLHLNHSAIYKRIRLERILSIDDLIILAKAYNLSIDELLNE